MNFSERLKALREEYNLTQGELGERLSISRQSVSNYEKGTRFPNDPKIILQISKLFNVSVDYLLGRTNVRETSDGKYLEVSEKSSEYDNISKEIRNLSPESQEELRKLIELYKLRDMQKRNSEFSDDLTSIE